MKMRRTCNCVFIEPVDRKPQGEWRTGIKKDPLYSLWKNMKYRCKRGTRYEKNYAHRDIQVCQQWLNDFRTFKRDIGVRPPKAHSVDRIDNSKGYCPHNCKWSTAHEQSLNSRCNKRKKSLPRWVYRTRNGKYNVKRSVKCKPISAGTFETLNEAIQAAKKLEIYGKIQHR